MPRAERTPKADGQTGRNLRRLAAIGGLCALSSAAGVAGAGNEGRTAQIVGLGAASCRQVTADATANPQVRKDYLAWAQGFMSGIILSRPPGVDVGLDLNPPTFGLMAQLRFLEDHCARNETIDFSTAVEALYKRLRLEGRT
jgi:hypothetical protein